MKPRPRPLRAALAAALAAAGCERPPPPAPPAAVDLATTASVPALAKAPPSEAGAAAPEEPARPAPAIKPPLPPVRAEQAPPPSPRAADLKEADLLRSKIAGYFQGHVGRRLHVQTDKPLYKPGETVWLKIWDLKARSLTGDHGSTGLNLELVSPRGAVVQKLRVRQEAGRGGAQADLPLSAGIPGGEYTLRVRTFDGHVHERPVIVSSYEAPRLQMKLEFLRKAYGAGDEVTASIAVRRSTGEPLREHPLVGHIRLDGQDLPSVRLTTDKTGEGVVRFQLPPDIAVGDGLLTVLADDGGLTESVARRVPIIVNRLSFAAYPEGGDLVEGVPGRVYFEAKNPLGKPADVAGKVVDDRGQAVADIKSVRDGLGRFDLTPAPGRSYHVEIEKPAGITERYPVPPSLVAGCTLRAFDDLDGEMEALRVAVRCSEARRVVVSATLRENHLDAAEVDVPKDAPAIVYLAPGGEAAALGRAQGVARVTVFDDKLNPLAERLVYRNRRARLNVQVEPERKGYAPREQVTLNLTTTDPTGRAVPAEIGLSVVDDTVLTFADDKTGHMLSRLYLEPEIPGKVEEPNFYFDLSEEKSGPAMDLLMGTRGYRKFEWHPVISPDRPRGQTVATGAPVPNFGGLQKRKALALAVAPKPEEPSKEPSAAAPEADKEAPRLQLPKEEAEKKARNEDPPPRHKPAEAQAEARQAPAQARPAPMKQPAPAATATPAPAPALNEQALARLARDEAPAGPLGMKDQAAAQGVLGLRGEGRGAAGAGLGLDLRGGVGKADKAARAPAAEPKKMEAKPMARAKRAADDMDALLDGDGDDVARGGAIARGPMRRPMPIARPPRPAIPWAPVRVFPVPNYQPDYSGPRTDFRETVFFQPSVRTDAEGRAQVRFTLSDAVTSFRVVGEGVGAGAAGRGEAILKSSLPFSMVAKAPVEVSEGDRIDMPLVLQNERERPLQVDLSASFGDLLKLERPVERTGGTIAAGAREALFYPISVTGKRGRSKLRFVASASGLRDEFERELVVSPRGFPQHVARSGQVQDRVVAELDLGDLLPGTADGKVRLYPSPVSSMVAGLEGLLQEPSGCFEQASSTNYPNVMILRYLKAQRHADAALVARTNQLLDNGYKRLVGYETPRKGYEWFGAAPGHEALTAYGLLEFTDMKEVYPDVDRQMLQRTAAWLRERRDGKGGYRKDEKALDSFGRASKEVTDAYITYSLTEAKQTGIDEEVAAMEALSRRTEDAYLLALAANSLLSYGRQEAGQAAVRRLLALQDASGGFLKAGHSITRSGGSSLHIETTALAVLALLKAGGQDDAVRRGMEWLVSHRGGYGQWGATQSTVLALKAMTAYAIASRRAQAPGDVTLRVNGKVVGRQHYEAGHRAPIVFGDVEGALRPGKNQIELQHEGKAALPYTLGIDYRALKPASSKAAAVELETALEKAQVGLGESVRLNVTVRNRTESGQPMTLVRVGLPGGLSFQTWQLKELRDKGLIGFYETGPREVNLYLRQMEPRQEVRIPLDLQAVVPGRYTGPASRAYLYYTSEHKSWVDGVQVTITP